MQSLHRARSRLVGERTALINQLRAALLERGITVPQGRRRLERFLELVLDREDAPPLLSPRIRLLIDDMRAQWRELDRRIAAFDAEFVAAARSDATARRLSTIPGIGTLNATALVAAVGNARSFARARDLAAWLGRASVENPFYPELRTPNCVAAFCPIMRAISASGTPALRSSAMASHALATFIAG
jgi:transposase